MAVAYQTSTTNTGSGASLAVDPPSGLAAGDLWLVGLQIDDNSCTMVVPSGWTAVDAQVTGGFPTYRWFWKTAGAGESAQTFTITSGAGSNNAVSVRLDGQHATVPIGEVATPFIPGSTGTTIDAPDIANVAENGSMAILWNGQGGSRTLTPPSGSTLGPYVAVAGTIAIGAAYEARNSGAYAPGNWTYSGTASSRIAQTFVVLPAAAAASTGKASGFLMATS